jgi:ribulose-5-phosphate 4-epimerase/fuculose-1-phosphate aldolase
MIDLAYRYTHKLPPSDAVIHLEIHDRLRLRDRLRARAEAAARRYGFVIADDDRSPVAGGHDGRHRLRHHLVVWDAPFDPDVVRSTVDRIGVEYDTASIAFAFPDDATSQASRPTIEAAKVQARDRLNIICPDQHSEIATFVSDYKLTQTMVAESVRVRYQPRQTSPALPAGLRERVLPFFLEASRRYAEHRLWHRGQMDGCIALRCEEGIAITATRTSKAPLEADRIVLVEGYDEATNTVTYRGPALPSSDSVELVVLAGQRPDLGAFLHTHASDLITRNPSFLGGVRVGVRASGEPALGHELVSVLSGHRQDLVVLEEHGELFVGPSPGGDFFTWFDEVLATARASVTG